MTLIDTSAWIEFFRGRSPYSEHVDELLADGSAAICGPIETEIRRGLRSDMDRKKILPLFEGCRLLSAPDDLWHEAGDLGYVLARKGLTIKSFDLLIITYALAHDVTILEKDRDFRAAQKAGIPLRLYGD